MLKEKFLRGLKWSEWEEGMLRVWCVAKSEGRGLKIKERVEGKERD